jgi:DNA-binding Lrp family transcriptional regulator
MMNRLDRTDFEIVRHLRNNARITNKDLAEKVGLAPSSCLLRVRALHREGVILGYHAEVDERALGVGLQAMIAVRLQHHTSEAVEAFRDRSLQLAEVLHVYHVAGANDFMVHVWVRDSTHLRELLMTAFTAWPEVDHLETGLIFEHARSTALPSYLDLEEG